MPDDKAKQYDPEETREEMAARRIDAASEQFAERCDKFVKTLRSNARSLTPYKRQITSAWLKRHCERLQSTLDEGDAIPPLGLDGLPDYDER
jgi:ribosomal protein L29